MSTIWRDGVNLEERGALLGDVKTDVLIIGGGMAGVLCASFLEKRGVDYILVEKGRICSGVTQNTTAKITYQHGLIYNKLVSEFGIDAGRMYLEANREAFINFAQMCANIDCDYQVKDNYVYSTNCRGKLEKELSALLKIGYAARFCESVSIPIKTVGAICFSDQAQFHPLKFAAELSRGLKIYENTFVKEIDGNTAITDFGRIKFESAVIATHFPFINRHGSYFLKLYQHRSYVLALDGAEDVYGMYVDEDMRGLSFRNYKGMLLLGGGSHRTGKRGGGWSELSAFRKEKYPSAREVYRFATQDCMTLDGMPYIGEYSKRTRGLYVACGFNKWGMTGSMLSAMVLSDMVCGKDNKYVRMLSPTRSILRKQLFINCTETAINMLTPIPKRCSHLGCALKYNKAEHSWDCACHGSRFDEHGEVIDNPAQKRIK